MNVTTAVTLVVALGGWVLAATTTWLTYKTKSDENYYRALDWMSGGTQKRNLGIAAIEGAWHPGQRQGHRTKRSRDFT